MNTKTKLAIRIICLILAVAMIVSLAYTMLYFIFMA